VSGKEWCLSIPARVINLAETGAKAPTSALARSSFLVFLSHYGFSNYGMGGGIGILGVVLIVALVLFLFGRGRR
jgi:hypothetical protein